MPRLKVTRREKEIINEIVYCKKKYAEGVATANEGLKNWARSQAKKYYAQLPSDLATFLKGVGYEEAHRYYLLLVVVGEEKPKPKPEPKPKPPAPKPEPEPEIPPPKPKELTMSQYRAVKSEFDQVGIPEWVWWPIMMCESGGNPNAHRVTRWEDSRGLFQINVAANPSYKRYDLYNPVVNARLIAEGWMLPVWRRAGINRDEPNFAAVKAVYKDGIRPAWTSSLEKKCENYYYQVKTGYYDASDGHYQVIQNQKADIDFSGGIKALGELAKGYAEAFGDFSQKIRKGEL